MYVCSVFSELKGKELPGTLKGCSNGYKNGLSSLELSDGVPLDVVKLGKYSGKIPLPKHIERMKVEVRSLMNPERKRDICVFFLRNSMFS